MMNNRNIQLVITCFVFTILSCSKSTTLPLGSAVGSNNIKTDIAFLSSDELEGREIGTVGERKAGDFIASRFAEIGLSPYGDNGTFFQTFKRKKNNNPHGDEPATTGVDVVGRNVIGYINNQATSTVIIGGHYDHLGYGAESSLYVGEPAIHNGADDNSSGVAGVIHLAESIKKSDLKKHNYLFICFSGEEKGLWGSNYFINNTTMDKSTFSYMVNMDMIGRLNAERKLAVSGIGTSPVFESVIDEIKQPNFSIKKEMSGIGPSDHASFYNGGVPVLAFFTGQHSDYHKPSDDAHLINYAGVNDIIAYIYNVVTKLDNQGKLTYTKTKDESQTRSSFSVTLGVMPDYMFDGKGMKIDGVKDGKTADKAGLIKGDIVTKMGEMEVTDMQGYMKCLSAFKPGDTIDIQYIRDGKTQVGKLTFD